MMLIASEKSPTFVGRQPIVDREQKLLAYQLFLSSDHLKTLEEADLLEQQLGATKQAEKTLSVGQVLGHYRGLIKTNQEFLLSKIIEELPSHQLVLELPENLEMTPDIVARCRHLRSLGFTFALDEHFQLLPTSDAYALMLSCVEIIKLSLSQLDGRPLPALAEQIKGLGKKMLVVDVETSEQMLLCRQLGFDLFQGYYFAHAALIDGKKLSTSQLLLFDLLSLLMKDADLLEIETVFKKEPGLSVNLLRLSNSAASGLGSTKISSLRQAITILGRRQLIRWVQVLFFIGDNTLAAQANPLLHLALTRARLMELLATQLSDKNKDLSEQAFITGLISLMPSLLGIAMKSILAQLPLTPPIADALGAYSGALGRLLLLVEATEKTDRFAVKNALWRQPMLQALSVSLVYRTTAEAMVWANSLQQESAAVA
ncbi:MAG: HDOD domain-containing protein [Pseudomonadota bacterium]